MTLLSSVSTRARPAISFSTACASDGFSSGAVVVSTVPFVSSVLKRSLMSHDVKNDVDAERIRNLLGKSREIFVVLAFAFPAVAVVRVVRGKNHDAPLVVKDHAVMRLMRIRFLPGHTAARPHTHARHLSLGFNVEHTMIQRMIERRVHQFAGVKNFL